MERQKSEATRTAPSSATSSQVKVQLRALCSTDAEQARRWRNDWRVIRWCRQRDFISDFQQGEWFRAQHADPKIQMYAIETQSDKGDWVMCGVAGFTDIDHVNSRAEFSLYIAPDLWGKGLGRAALTCLLNHGFQNLGLNQIWGEVFDENPALKLFESLGFEKTGKRKAWYWKEGQLIDTHLITMFACYWALKDAAIYEHSA